MSMVMHPTGRRANNSYRTTTDMNTHEYIYINTVTNRQTNMASVCGGGATPPYTEYAEHILYRYVLTFRQRLSNKRHRRGERKRKKLPIGRVESGL